MTNPISFPAIFKKLNGPQTDGGYTVSFDVSEDAWKEIAVLPAVSGKLLQIDISTKDGS